MPIHKVGSKWEWGSGHGTFDSEAGAERQERAARANGYTGKSLDVLDRVIGMTAVLAKAGKRHYLKEGEKPPAGVEVKEGTRGGKYIEIGQFGHGTGSLDAMDANGLQDAADKLKERKARVLEVAQQLEPDNPDAARQQMEHWQHLDNEHEMIKDRIRAKMREGTPQEPKPQAQHIRVPQLDAHGNPKQSVRPEFQGVADELAGAGLDQRDEGLDQQGLEARAQDLRMQIKGMQDRNAPLANVMRAGDRLRRINDKLGEMAGGGEENEEPFPKTPEFSDPQKAVDLYQRRENLIQRQLAGAQRDGDTKLARELQGDLKDVQGKRVAAEAKVGGGDQGKLGPQAQAAMGEFDQLQAKLKAGELENPQELVDAARRVAQAYEGDKQQLGQGDLQKHALQGALDDATQKHERGKELYESWKQRFEYARDKGAPAEEVRAARERMDAAEDEYHSARMYQHNAEKALHQHNNRGKQPQPAPDAQAQAGRAAVADWLHHAGAAPAPAAPAPRSLPGAATMWRRGAAAPAAQEHAGEARFPLGGAWDRPQGRPLPQNDQERAAQSAERKRFIAEREAADRERKERAASANAKVPPVPEGPKKGRIGRVPQQWGAFGAEPRDFGPDELFPGDFQAERAAWKAGKNWVVRGPGGYQVADKMPAQGGDFMRIRPDGIVENYRGKVKGAKAPKAGNPGGSTPAAFGPAGKHHAEKEIAKLGNNPGVDEARELYLRVRGGEFIRDLQAKHPDWTKQQLNRYWKAYFGAVTDMYNAAWRRKREADQQDAIRRLGER